MSFGNNSFRKKELLNFSNLPESVKNIEKELLFLAFYR